MKLEDIQHLENQQKLMEQRTFQEFKAKELEARDAYLTYYNTYCQKLELKVLQALETTNLIDIEELNNKINDILILDATNNNIVNVFQLHCEKKWSELKIIQMLIHNKLDEEVKGIKL